MRRSIPWVFIILSLGISRCSNPVGEHHPEWKKYFDDNRVTGCIEIFDILHSKFIDYNPDRCAQRFIPASTFKICNSLIALETKTIADTSTVLKWDSVMRNVPSWNQDQSMSQAFRNSNIWNGKLLATVAEEKVKNQNWTWAEASNFWTILNAHILLKNR